MSLLRGTFDYTLPCSVEGLNCRLPSAETMDVLELEDYLGETRVIIDQIVDQAPNGLEVLRGLWVRRSCRIYI